MKDYTNFLGVHKELRGRIQFVNYPHLGENSIQLRFIKYDIMVIHGVKFVYT